MKLFIDIVMKRIYLFNIAAWNYRKKIGFPVCKRENFAGLQAHRKRGKSARASPTPHHTFMKSGALVSPPNIYPPWFKSTPRNMRNLFKMANRRFSFLSFILWLISNLIACFQGNLALLILQADYSRRRQSILGLLSLPVSRSGRLDLPLVWLCFALILTF